MARIGYNMQKIQEEIDKIETAYKQMGTQVSSEWETVVSTLHTNWRGDDEQSFEKTLAKKINGLYDDARIMANEGRAILQSLGEKWHKSQQGNILEAAETVNATVYNVTCEPIAETGDLITFKETAISNSEDLGLIGEGDARGAIQTSLESFKNNIMSQVEGLIDTSTIASAFFGEEQTTSIQTFVEDLRTALGEILVAFKDMHDAVSQLAGSSYENISSAAAEAATSASSSVNNAVEQAGGRWQ